MMTSENLSYLKFFKEKHRISNDKCHIRRRLEKGTLEKEFVNQVENLKQTNDNDFIINIDETLTNLLMKQPIKLLIICQ